MAAAGGRRAPGTGTAPRLRADGRWECRYTDPRTGRQRSVYGATPAAAIRRRTDALRAVARGQAPATPTRWTVASWCAYWLATLPRDTRPTTRLARQGAVQHHIVPGLGSVRLGALTRQDCQAWARGQLDRYAVNTVRNQVGTLVAALQAAVEADLIPRNPALRLRLPSPPVREPVMLREADVWRVLQSLEQHRLYPLFVLGVHTGLRGGELTALRWGDIDLDAGTLTVRRGLAFIEREWHATPGKSRRALRTIPLPPVVVAALRPAQGQPEALLFTSRDGTPLHSGNLAKFLALRLTRLGLPPLSLHEFCRHGFASLMLAAGENIAVVSRLLGHSSVAMTLDVYRHLLPDESRGAVDRLAARLQGSESRVIGSGAGSARGDAAE